MSEVNLDGSEHYLDICNHLVTWPFGAGARHPTAYADCMTILWELGIREDLGDFDRDLSSVGRYLSAELG